MNTHALFLEPVRDRRAPARRLCFAPFEKGGYGGFTFDLAPEQKQIPLDPPFSKGEAKALPLAAEVSGQAAP
jgi:hypothetical protein